MALQQSFRRHLVRLKAAADGGRTGGEAGGEVGVFSGYGTVFGVADLDGDVIDPGAFTASLDRHKAAGTMPKLLWQHDPAQPIGIWESIVADAHGLKMHGRLALGTRRGAEAHELLKLGALDGLSLGFSILKAGRDAAGRRLILEADLHECSPVTFPCQPAARVDVVKTVQTQISETGILEQNMNISLDSLNRDVTALKTAVAGLVRPDLGGGEDKGGGLGRMIRALAAGRGDPARAAAFAAKSWGDSFTAKALEAGTGTAGGYLVPEAQSAEVMELLRPASVIRRLGATVVPMPHGTLLLARLAGGSQADYIGENQMIPATQPTFAQVRLTARKLAALVPVSNDLIRYAGGAADTVVRDDLVAALAQRQDQAFLYGTAGGNGPTGLRHLVHADHVMTARSGQTEADVVADLSRMMLALRQANCRMLKPAWIMAPRTELALMNLRDPLGGFVFRAEMQAGRLNGFAYAVTTQIAVSGGAEEDESDLFLVDMADAVIGDSAGLLIDASGEAAYQAGGSVVPAFSLDQTVIRCIAAHDFTLRHERSAAVLTGVRWMP